MAAINIGAINAEQIGYYCDSLTTGSDVEDIKENLEDYYDITNRESALETLKWLYNEGHSVYFDKIKEAVSEENAQFYCDNLESEETACIEEYFFNLEDAVDDLIEEDLRRCSVVAWDMGRLVLVARCCFDAGYIFEEAAWRYINNARRTSKEHYNSWEEFARGYVIGRAMWSGSGITLNGIISIAQGLLEDEESPWKQIMF